MKKLLVCSIAIAMVLGFGLTLNPAQAYVEIDGGGIGDVLLFSMYDLRDNVEDRTPRTGAWQNYLAIENTSGA